MGHLVTTCYYTRPNPGQFTIMTVKTRFAPSPTGVLHVGGVRTALFSWLYARRHGGSFVLRIEDTDVARSTEESVAAILEGLKWLELDYDEGPYFQTKRLSRYDEVVNQWLEEGLAYFCYCTREELDQRREEQASAGENPGYDGRCRERREPREGVQPVVRFRVPDEGEVEIDDQVRGRVVIGNKEIEDFIIRRSDGVPTYNFSVVVDDADMQISHVIRGDDHLINTPKQIHMFRALGVQVPVFAHVPMILGDDGSRLSKRHGAVNVLDYREQGFLPEALLNYLIRLGWSHGDQELFTIEEMTNLFDIVDVNASASKFDQDKLKWLNRQYLMAASPARIAPLLAGQLQALGLHLAGGPAPEDVVVAYRERADTLKDMAFAATYCYADFDDIDPAAQKKHLRPIVNDALHEVTSEFQKLENWDGADFVGLITDIAERHGLTMGKLGQPIRVAVTGGSNSPPLDVTLRLVGKDRSLQRLATACAIIVRRIQQAD